MSPTQFEVFSLFYWAYLAETMESYQLHKTKN